MKNVYVTKFVENVNQGWNCTFMPNGADRSNQMEATSITFCDSQKTNYTYEMDEYVEIPINLALNVIFHYSVSDNIPFIGKVNLSSLINEIKENPKNFVGLYLTDGMECDGNRNCFRRNITIELFFYKQITKKIKPYRLQINPPKNSSPDKNLPANVIRPELKLEGAKEFTSNDEKTMLIFSDDGINYFKSIHLNYTGLFTKI